MPDDNSNIFMNPCSEIGLIYDVHHAGHFKGIQGPQGFTGEPTLLIIAEDYKDWVRECFKIPLEEIPALLSKTQIFGRPPTESLIIKEILKGRLGI